MAIFVKWRKTNDNLGSSFEQTLKASHPKCYISSPKVIGLLVPEKTI